VRRTVIGGVPLASLNIRKTKLGGAGERWGGKRGREKEIDGEREKRSKRTENGNLSRGRTSCLGGVRHVRPDGVSRTGLKRTSAETSGCLGGSRR